MMTSEEFIAHNILAKARLDDARAYWLLKNDAMAIASLKVAKEEIQKILDEAASESGVFYLAK